MCEPDPWAGRLVGRGGVTDNIWKQEGTAAWVWGQSPDIPRACRQTHTATGSLAPASRTHAQATQLPSTVPCWHQRHTEPPRQSGHAQLTQKKAHTRAHTYRHKHTGQSCTEICAHVSPGGWTLLALLLAQEREAGGGAPGGVSELILVSQAHENIE